MTHSLAFSAIKWMMAAAIVPVAQSAFTARAPGEAAAVQPDATPTLVEVGDSRHEFPVSGDGLYYLDAASAHANVQMVIDSGANTTILTQADARRLGLHPEKLRFRARLVTANGEAPLAFVRLGELVIAGKRFQNVRVAVFGRQGGVSLLGQDLIRRFGTFSMSDGVVRIEG